MFQQYRKFSEIFRINLPPLHQVYLSPSWTCFLDNEVSRNNLRIARLKLFGDTLAMMEDIKKYGDARLPPSFIRYKLKQYHVYNADVRNIIICISKRLSASHLAEYYPMWEEWIFGLYTQGYGWLDRVNRHCWVWGKR